MLTGISLLGSALAMKWVMSSIDPNKDAKNKASLPRSICAQHKLDSFKELPLDFRACRCPAQAKKRKEEIQKRLGRRITLDGLEFVSIAEQFAPRLLI